MILIELIIFNVKFVSKHEDMSWDAETLSHTHTLNIFFIFFYYESIIQLHAALPFVFLTGNRDQPMTGTTIQNEDMYTVVTKVITKWIFANSWRRFARKPSSRG